MAHFFVCLGGVSGPFFLFTGLKDAVQWEAGWGTGAQQDGFEQTPGLWILFSGLWILLSDSWPFAVFFVATQRCWVGEGQQFYWAAHTIFLCRNTSHFVSASRKGWEKASLLTAG